jgi:hypothetical protein
MLVKTSKSNPFGKDGEVTSYSVKSGKPTHITVPYNYAFSMQIERGFINCLFLQFLKTPGNAIGVKKYRERYQIEPDGAIYLIPPDVEAPVARLPSQPIGRPFRPQQ